MKVTLTNISDNFLREFTLKKAIDNGFLKEYIDSQLLYLNADHDYLTKSAIAGDDKETGTITQICGIETFTKDIILKHNEGKFNLQDCITEKKITFTNPLDCIANKEINIFEYNRAETETIQGEIDRINYSFGVDANIGEAAITKNSLLNILPAYPDHSVNGYFIEYISLTAAPNILIENGVSTYLSHNVTSIVMYYRIRSAIKHSDLWLPIPSSAEFYYSISTDVEYKAPIETIIVMDQGGFKYYYNNYIIEAGKLNTFTDVTISNTVSINEIIIDLFVCSGLAVISNFLGINPDLTEPDNKYYDFATENCKAIKIVQSYDVIRESATEDSFNQSGNIKAKDFFSEFMKPFNLLIVPDFANNLVRIEHISYFIRKGIDITNIDYEFSELELNREKVDSETFSFAAPTPTKGFYEIKLNYENLDLYNEPNDVQYKNKIFLTDVFGTLNNEDYNQDQYKKLFYLLATKDNEIIGLNTSFSIKNLVLSLHDINRPMKIANIEGVQMSFGGYSIGFEGEIKIVSNVLQWRALWPLMSVKTKYGTYLIDEIEISQDNELKLKIKK